MTRILLVDDDRDVLESTAELLRGFGYDVTTCRDADRVLETMRGKYTDIVLQDVRMPGLDLRAQIQAIRDDPRLREIPVVLFTAVLSAKELAEEVGADDAIEKPFTPETLRKVLQSWETRKSASMRGHLGTSYKKRLAKV